ncbi:MAG: uncharacterized protein JWM76_3867 [Pseudonocardiales bacterium]|nr:uncharacterized protein [Pseudonocardiales bacterium]
MQALTEVMSRSPDSAELLPSRIAEACQRVLSVDGASVSIFSDDFRVPLGASDAVADRAERLQFTLGQGPCLDAHRDHETVAVTEPDMLRRWPAFSHALHSQTPYRSVVSVPFDLSKEVGGAVDLYSHDAHSLPRSVIREAGVIADTVALLMLDGPPSAQDHDVEVPAWMDNPGVQRRELIWLALGTVNVETGLSTIDGLALLRGYCFSHDLSLDDVTHAMYEGTFDASRLYE